jgi:hypothetical protein
VLQGSQPIRAHKALQVQPKQHKGTHGTLLQSLQASRQQGALQITHHTQMAQTRQPKQGHPCPCNSNQCCTMLRQFAALLEHVHRRRLATAPKQAATCAHTRCCATAHQCQLSCTTSSKQPMQRCNQACHARSSMLHASHSTGTKCYCWSREQ